jgi:hypothetical protein
MRKSILVILFIISSAITFSESKMTAITILLEDGLDANSVEIGKLAQGLSDNERYAIIHNYKKEPGLPFIANLFLGFGIGSFIQKDINGGLIGLVGDVSGTVLLTTGLLLPGGTISSINWSKSLANNPLAIGLILTGTGVSVVSKVFQLIRPWTFSSSFNKNLIKVLSQENNKISLDVFPSENGLVYQVAYKIRY